VEHKVRVLPDFEHQTKDVVIIDGNLGNMKEKGKIYQNPDGSVSIDRQIGDYIINEKIIYGG
jgi:hypothetical protein